MSYAGAAASLFYFWLACQIPYSLDDWRWGSSVGLERLLSGFRDYNGRYLGNLLEIALTRAPVLKAIVMAATYFALTRLAITSAREQGSRAEGVLFVLANLLFLALPRAVFRQTVGWVGGYTNFVAPVLLSLVYFGMTRDVFCDEKPRYGIAKTIAVVPLCVSMQLFCEHNTIYNVLYALFVLSYAWAKHRKAFALHVVGLCSTVIGAAAMFANSEYLGLLTGTKVHGYRSLVGASTEGFLGKALKFYVSDVSSALIADNVALNAVIIVLCIALVVGARGARRRALGHALCAVLAIYGAYCGARTLYPAWSPLPGAEARSELGAIVSIAYYLAVCVSVACFVGEKGARTRLLVLFVSAAVYAMPLVIARPIGPRCFFASYSMYVLFALGLFEHVVRAHGLAPRRLLVPLASCLLVAMAYHASIYWHVGSIDRERMAIIEDGVRSEATTIVIPGYGAYSDYVFSPDPSKKWEGNFKEFYGIPQGTTVKVR
jgi:hypothetical protein